jgi:hypothetical protein
MDVSTGAAKSLIDAVKMRNGSYRQRKRRRVMSVPKRSNRISRREAAQICSKIRAGFMELRNGYEAIAYRGYVVFEDWKGELSAPTKHWPAGLTAGSASIPALISPRKAD